MSSRARRQRRRMTNIDGRQFVGVWNVKAGSPLLSGEPKYDMKIEHSTGDEYDLYYRVRPDVAAADGGGWQKLQQLEYMADTGTLENRVGDDGQPRRISEDSDLREPERCINFWNCMTRNRAKKCAIFAMRVGPNRKSRRALPYFEDGEDGSWGAEEGGG